MVLGGSWARGDAHRASDIDLWALGVPARDLLRWRPPFLVSIHRTPVRDEARRLRWPPYVGGSVPGWRRAILLYDPSGAARRLRDEARRFRWERIARRCDRWVGEQIVAWGEEAIKLVRALGTRNDATAAVQRNLLADALGFVMAVHRREFWDSENEAWERIGRSVGGPWARAQRAALGLTPATFEGSARAALRLYARTADAVGARLTREQRAIVARVRSVAGPSGR